MKQLTIVNKSYDIVLCNVGHSSSKSSSHGEALPKELNVILPSVAMTLKVANFGLPITLTPQTVMEKSSSVDEKWSVSPNGFSIRMPMALGALWKAVAVPDNCPWRVYRSKVILP